MGVVHVVIPSSTMRSRISWLYRISTYRMVSWYTDMTTPYHMHVGIPVVEQV